jgi:hypothetical protein
MLREEIRSFLLDKRSRASVETRCVVHCPRVVASLDPSYDQSIPGADLVATDCAVCGKGKGVRQFQWKRVVVGELLAEHSVRAMPPPVSDVMAIRRSGNSPPAGDMSLAPFEACVILGVDPGILHQSWHLRASLCQRQNHRRAGFVTGSTGRSCARTSGEAFR